MNLQCLFFVLLVLLQNKALSISFCGKIFDFDEIEKQLTTEKIISMVPMEEFLLSKGHVVHFTSTVYLLTLSTGIQAVLKLVDSSFPRDAIAEVAAYKASQFLEINLVPPTILYNRDGLIGSLQYYVEPSFDLMIENNYEKAKKKACAQDLANIEIFYFVFGQWDPDPSNLIAVEVENRIHFALIDNAAIGYLQKTRYGDYPFVLCFPNALFSQTFSSKKFPFDDVRLLSPDVNIWKKEFGTILSKKNIKKICNQKWHPIAFIIWNGHFWRQYRFGLPAHTDFYPYETIKKLKKIDHEKLQKLYDNQLGCTFTNEYFNEIIERKNQIIKASNLSKNILAK